jgi:phosphoenolpyruvate synthase/pyruvate phosphate dikinase
MFNILSKNNKNKNVLNAIENEKNIIWFSDCNLLNKNLVGGKCSSLGELKKLSKELNFNIADGFAISTLFYEDFLYLNNLNEKIYENFT